MNLSALDAAAELSIIALAVIETVETMAKPCLITKPFALIAARLQQMFIPKATHPCRLCMS